MVGCLYKSHSKTVFAIICVEIQMATYTIVCMTLSDKTDILRLKLIKKIIPRPDLDSCLMHLV